MGDDPDVKLKMLENYNVTKDKEFARIQASIRSGAGRRHQCIVSYLAQIDEKDGKCIELNALLSPPDLDILFGKVKNPSKIAIVTGAGSGIGQAIAEQFYEDGHHLVLLDVNTETEKIAKELHGDFIKCDVSDPDNVKQAMDKV